MTEQKENKEVTDYIDSKGNKTIAADLGYATIIVTKTDNTRLEKYYDEKGKQISRRNGYYELFEEYDNKGNKTRIAYLNHDGEPMIMANGYAIEEREYNEEKQAIKVSYYNTDGNPIETPLFGHGKINEYNSEGKIHRIIYIDENTSPVMTGLGYSSIVKKYYTSGDFEGKVESEYYFDDKGEPVSLSLGQYGVHKEYDEYGRESVLTYLDANGQPIVTNKGYTTVARTFMANNRVETERYFDLEGNPYSLSEGQYGIKNENGHTIYLNKNGEEAFNLRMLLYNQSWIVIPLVVFVILLSVLMDKKLNYVLLLFSVLSIIYFTLLFRETEGIKINGFLSYYKRIFTDNEARSDILKNIWLFIPLGAILYKLYQKKPILLIPFALSIAIELIQLVSGTGICELDDVISNSLGGLIGYISGKLTTDIVSRIKSRRHIHTA